MKTKSLIFIMLTALLSVSSCKKENPGPNQVFIQSDDSGGFNPTSISVSKGTTVTWTNKQSIIHTVTSDNGVFDSGDLSKGKQFSYTFSTAGTFPYHCNHHSLMKATVTVQ